MKYFYYVLDELVLICTLFTPLRLAKSAIEWNSAFGNNYRPITSLDFRLVTHVNLDPEKLASPVGGIGQLENDRFNKELIKLISGLRLNRLDHVIVNRSDVLETELFANFIRYSASATLFVTVLSALEIRKAFL